MLRFSVVWSAVWLIVFLSDLTIVATAVERRPNVLIVLTDDQGFGDITSHGNAFVKTPRQDRLATEGARFDRFFVSPVCAPTRASLLTGRWHLRTGVHGVTRGFETMRSEEVTVAELFARAGYATAAVGKWHNGAHYPEHPRGQGFADFFGFCAGHFNNYFDSRLERNGEVVDFQGFIIDRLTDSAVDFIDRHREEPWFCYVAYNTPHSPWQVPEANWDAVRDRTAIPDAKARCAYAMVENIDTNLGRLLDAVEAHGLSRNTIVVFLTDNGANSQRYNAGMRGRKGSLHEGGSRVPCFVRWPAKIPPGRVIRPITAHIDLLPTLCEMCRIPVPTQLQIDGRSWLPLMLQESNCDWPERTLFSHWGDDATQRPRTDRGAVRTERWRAVLDRNRWQLFDIRNDPGEQHDLAAFHPDVIDQLNTAYRRWLADVSVNGFERIPIQVGHAAAPTVVLPAHEAQLKVGSEARPGAGIRYQGRAGWANDWITGWTSDRATATWDLSVVESGTYELSMYYAASDDQTSNVLQVSVGESRLESAVAVAHKGSVIANHDRVERKEVAERDWAHRVLGTLQLKVGNQPLVVQAVRIESNELLDLKAIVLIKK